MSQPGVYVTPETAIVWVPVTPRPTWSWDGPNGNGLEYEWGVEFSNGQEKLFIGFLKFSRGEAGGAPRHGSLSELLKAGQFSAFIETRSGGKAVEGVWISGVTTPEEDGITMVIRGATPVARLFSARPAAATFRWNVQGSPGKLPVTITYPPVGSID